jgi:hypothetical protein
MKRMFLVLAATLLVTGGVFAQEDNAAANVEGGSDKSVITVTRNSSNIKVYIDDKYAFDIKKGEKSVTVANGEHTLYAGFNAMSKTEPVKFTLNNEKITIAINGFGNAFTPVKLVVGDKVPVTRDVVTQTEKTENKEKTAAAKNTAASDPMLAKNRVSIAFKGGSNFTNPDSNISSGDVFQGVVSYERRLSPHFAVLGSFAIGGGKYNTSTGSGSDNDLGASISIDADAFFRWYVMRKTWYIQAGLGYGLNVYKSTDSNIENAYGNFFEIPIETGWKIDFGKPGGLVLEPAIGYNIGLPAKVEDKDVKAHGVSGDVKWYPANAGFYAKIGLGWAF